MSLPLHNTIRRYTAIQRIYSNNNHGKSANKNVSKKMIVFWGKSGVEKVTSLLTFPNLAVNFFSIMFRALSS